MIFGQIEAGGDRNFSYLIGDEDSSLCAVVDPGYDTSKLEARVKDLGLKVAYIFNTHTHHDHVAGNGVFHQGDVQLAAYKEARVNPDIELDHRDVMQLGKLRSELLFIPGHYLAATRLLVMCTLLTRDT